MGLCPEHGQLVLFAQLLRCGDLSRKACENPPPVRNCGYRSVPLVAIAREIPKRGPGQPGLIFLHWMLRCMDASSAGRHYCTLCGPGPVFLPPKAEGLCQLFIGPNCLGPF